MRPNSVLGLPVDVATHIAAHVERELGFRMAETRQIHGGNNLLVVLTAVDGRRLLAKVYQPDDARHTDRLGREFRALRFLRETGFQDVPRPYLCCDTHRYGVYSFEEGKVRPPSQLTEADADRVVGFLLRLEALGPPCAEPDLPPRGGAGPTVAARLAGYRATLDDFRTRSRETDALPSLREAAASPALDKAEAALKGLEDADAANTRVAAALTRDDLRLSQGDFGAHNTLFRDDGTPCFLDFEYAAWADPCWVVAAFVHHEANADVPRSVRAHFLDTYRRGTRLATVERLALMLRLAEVAWVVEHIAGTRPDRLRIGAQTTPGFDPDAYVAHQIRRFEERLAAYLRQTGTNT